MNIIQRLFNRPVRNSQVSHPMLEHPQDRQVLGNLTSLALESVRTAYAGKTPNERLSRDDSDYLGVLARFEQSFAGYPNDYSRRVRKVFRKLAQSDDDVSGAIRDMVILANPGHTVRFEGGTRAIAQAAREYETWVKTIYTEGGGINGLANNQIAEAMKIGASSCEWFPTKNKKGVQDVAILPAENIGMSRDPETQRYRYWQNYTALGEVELNTLTYKYVPLTTDGANPQGVPLIISSLDAADRKRVLLDAETRVLQLMSRSALVQATMPKPTPREVGLESELHPEYPTRVAAAYKRLAELILASSDAGVFVTPLNTEMNVIGINQTAQGAVEVVKGNNRRLWSATRTLGFMRGMDSSSVSEAQARVVYPILEADALSLSNVVAQQLQFGINLHLRLRGIAAQAVFEFEQAPSAFAESAANAELLKARTDAVLKNEVFGADWAIHAANRWSVKLEEDSKNAPDSWRDPTVTPPGQQNPIGPNNQITLRFNRSANKYALK